MKLSIIALILIIANISTAHADNIICGVLKNDKLVNRTMIDSEEMNGSQEVKGSESEVQVVFNQSDLQLKLVENKMLYDRSIAMQSTKSDYIVSFDRSTLKLMSKASSAGKMIDETKNLMMSCYNMKNETLAPFDSNYKTL